MKDRKRQLHNKNVLITGGSGFLGDYLARALKDICAEVYLYKKDIRSIDTFSRTFDVVCHLAAVNKIDSHNKAGVLFDINVNGTLAVLHYCCKKGARCVFASSSAVYKPSVNEKSLRENSKIEPVSLYGISKMLAENVCKHYAENFGIPVTALRIYNMYGPGQKPPFLIPYVTGQLTKKKPVILQAPKAICDFVFVTDIVRAFILSCAYKQEGFGAINIGTGRGIRINDLTRKISLMMKSKQKTIINKTKHNKDSYVIANPTKAGKTIGWHPLVHLERGLQMCLSDVQT